MKEKIHRQRKLKDRRRGGYGLPPHLYRAAADEAVRFNVTLPFVITVAVATALRKPIEAEDDYRRLRVAARKKRA